MIGIPIDLSVLIYDYHNAPTEFYVHTILYF